MVNRLSVVALFVVHNVLFFIGLSVYGDYPDYIIFSLEYLIFCFIVFAIGKTNYMLVKAFRIIAIVAICVGFIVGAIGTLLFIVVSQDYEADKVFHFQVKDKHYETRRYSYRFAASEDMRYTFDTYKQYKYLPFEQKIDKTSFFSLKTDVNVAEDRLVLRIIETEGKQI